MHPSLGYADMGDGTADSAWDTVISGARDLALA